MRHDRRAPSSDTLLSVDFAGPGVAVVFLRIGYPPFLYTDVLSCLRVDHPVARRGETEPRPPGWWIVAKSSVSEPFLVDTAEPLLTPTPAASAPPADYDVAADTRSDEE